MTPTPTAELVVPIDRPAIDRWHRRLVVIHVVLLVVIVLVAVALTVVVAVVLDQPTALIGVSPFLILVLGQVFQIAVHVSIWRQRLAVEVPLRLSPAGLVVSQQQGSYAVPWDVVTHATLHASLGHRVLRFHLDRARAGTDPRVRTDLPPRLWRRVLRAGVPVGSVGVAVPLEEILRAATWFSGGRVLAR